MRRHSNRPLVGLAVVGLALIGCQQAPPEPREADSRDSVAQPAQKTTEPGVQTDGSVVSAVKWFDGTIEEAIREAGTRKVPIFVEVGAYWCPPCHKMDEQTFVDEGIGELLSSDYVSLHIDAEKGDGPEIAERYDVQAFPTILVLESSGNERGRLIDFHDPAALRAGLERIQNGTSALQALESAVAEAPEDLQAKFALAHAYALAAQRDKAQPLYDEVAAKDVNDEAGLASRVAYDRALFFTFNLDDDRADAIAQLRDVQTQFPDSKSAARAYKHIARIQHADGQTDAALATLDDLLGTKPEGDPGVASTYGWFCFRERARPERGLEVVQTALKDTDDWADLHYLAAELSRMTDQPQAALAQIRAANELEPKSHFYRRQVARFEAIAAGKGDPEGLSR